MRVCLQSLFKYHSAFGAKKYRVVIKQDGQCSYHL